MISSRRVFSCFSLKSLLPQAVYKLGLEVKFSRRLEIEVRLHSTLQHGRFALHKNSEQNQAPIYIATSPAYSPACLKTSRSRPLLWTWNRKARRSLKMSGEEDESTAYRRIDVSTLTWTEMTCRSSKSRRGCSEACALQTICPKS